MWIKDIFNKLKKRIDIHFGVRISDDTAKKEIPSLTIHLILSEYGKSEIENICNQYNLTAVELMDHIIRLGILANKIESQGGMIGFRKKDSKRIEYVSFLKDLDNKRQVARLLEEVLKTIPKQEEN